MSREPGGTYIYTPLYRSFSYGPEHPLRPTRLHLAHTLIKASGLLEQPGVKLLEPREASRNELQRVHSRFYLDALELANGGEPFPNSLKWGLGYGDNPIFAGVRDWSYLVCGGTLEAMREVVHGRSSVAFHTGGGFHHAHHARAAGFCYVNDIAVAISEQMEQGLRILYLDIDAHHGDGVQEAFYGSDRVFTISIHESPDQIFPGTGYVNETGEGKGDGFAINVPLEPGSSDVILIKAFDTIVPKIYSAFSPDILVLQLGVDSMSRDPLAHLMMTTRSLVHVLEKVLEMHEGPLMATGGGGYEMDTVARAWTLAWGILSGQEVLDELPDAYLKERRKYGATGISRMTVRDPDTDTAPDQTIPMKQLENVLEFLRGEGMI